MGWRGQGDGVVVEEDRFQMGFQDKVTSTSDELNTESERQDESRYNEVSPYMKSGAIYKTGKA